MLLKIRAEGESTHENEHFGAGGYNVDDIWSMYFDVVPSSYFKML